MKASRFTAAAAILFGTIAGGGALSSPAAQSQSPGSGQCLQFRCLTGAPEDLLHRLSQRAAPDGRPVARPRRHATDRRRSGLVGARRAQAAQRADAAVRPAAARQGKRGRVRRRPRAVARRSGGAWNESGTAGHPSADQNRVRERRPRPAGARHRRAQPAAGRRYRPARVRQQLRSPVALAVAARALPVGCADDHAHGGGPATVGAGNRDVYDSRPAVPGRPRRRPAALRLARRRGHRPSLPRRRRLHRHHPAAEDALQRGARPRRSSPARAACEPRARAHVHRRRRRSQTAAGQLRRHADLEPGVGAVREPCRRTAHGDRSDQGRNASRRRRLRAPGVGTRRRRAAAAHRLGIWHRRDVRRQSRGRERDDRRALQGDRRERHPEPPAHFHLPAENGSSGR